MKREEELVTGVKGRTFQKEDIATQGPEGDGEKVGRVQDSKHYRVLHDKQKHFFVVVFVQWKAIVQGENDGFFAYGGGVGNEINE